MKEIALVSESQWEDEKRIAKAMVQDFGYPLPATYRLPLHLQPRQESPICGDSRDRLPLSNLPLLVSWPLVSPEGLGVKGKALPKARPF